MKHLLRLLLAIGIWQSAIGNAAAAVAANDLILTQRNAANNNNTAVYVAPTNNALLAFSSSGVPEKTLVPTGLTSIGVNSVTAAASTNLTLAAGSGNQSVLLSPSGTGSVLVSSAIKGTFTGDNTTLAVKGRTGGYAGILSAQSIGTINATRVEIVAEDAADLITFYTPGASTGMRWFNASERMRLVSTGNLLIGGTTDITGSGGAKAFGTTDATNTTSGAWQVAGGGSVQLKFFAGAFGESVQSLTGSGAVNVTAGTTIGNSTGGGAWTLADGSNGQTKTIVMTVDAGDGTLTPTTKTGFSTITFDAVGDSVTLRFFTTLGWMVIANYNATVNP